MERKLFEIQIPVAPNPSDAYNPEAHEFGNDNHGYRFAPKHHQKFFAYILNTTGIDGYSVLPEVSGVWQSPEGTVYREKMIPVRIACDHNWQIAEIAGFAKEHYEQEAIFVAELGTANLY